MQSLGEINYDGQGMWNPIAVACCYRTVERQVFVAERFESKPIVTSVLDFNAGAAGMMKVLAIGEGTVATAIEDEEKRDASFGGLDHPAARP